MTSQREEPKPGFQIFVGIVVAALLAAAGALIETRITVAQHEVRIGRAEQEASMLRDLPSAISRIEEKLESLTREVARLRGDDGRDSRGRRQ